MAELVLLAAIEQESYPIRKIAFSETEDERPVTPALSAVRKTPRKCVLRKSRAAKNNISRFEDAAGD